MSASAIDIYTQYTFSVPTHWPLPNHHCIIFFICETNYNYCLLNNPLAARYPSILYSYNNNNGVCPTCTILLPIFTVKLIPVDNPAAL